MFVLAMSSSLWCALPARIAYHATPEPPLEGDDAARADALLRAAGLR